MFTLLCLLLSTVNGQVFNMNSMPPPEISMSYSDGGVKKNSTVSIEVVIPENWHVNANKVTDDFLKPSSVEIAARGIKFGEPIWPEPIKEFNEALDLEILVFKGKFQIRIPVDSVEDGYDSLSTNAIFHYQACDNSICLAPAQVEVKIGGASGLEGSSKLKGASSVNGAANDAAKNDAASLKKNNEGDAFGAAPILLLFFAFLGGIILNLMPCVLPVLSLKLFSLINQAGESRKRLMALGFATTAGILASFWVLAVIISAIKAGGGAAGWGMQFQSAGFIAFMVVILAAFAMSFFGVFEVWLPGGATTRMDEAGRKAGLGGAFFTGALLVLLSTPCSAPLLGTAMGFAFTASTPVLFLFFTAAGVGLALPYLLVSFFPKILNVLPKPGAWMVTLQKVMGVLLLATVAWLLWVVNEQAGTTGVLLFAAVAAIAIACSFAIGKIAPPGAAFAREIGAFTVSAVVLAALWFALLGPKYEAVVTERFEARASEQMLEGGWYRYSEKLVADFAKSGRTVFIDVTADWCLTCKANEAAVLSGSEFLRKMDSAGVARVKADWTRETPEVNALLKSMGKSGVPAYAIYPHGDAGKQFVLPELLTTDAILEKLP
ncbi:MAG: thioredoxin family protein [Fibrobacter sp.]|nr:thioredoxin family protein [Fibrobacter sp.]